MVLRSLSMKEETNLPALACATSMALCRYAFALASKNVGGDGNQRQQWTSDQDALFQCARTSEAFNMKLAPVLKRCPSPLSLRFGHSVKQTRVGLRHPWLSNWDSWTTNNGVSSRLLLSDSIVKLEVYQH